MIPLKFPCLKAITPLERFFKLLLLSTGCLTYMLGFSSGTSIQQQQEEKGQEEQQEG